MNIIRINGTDRAEDGCEIILAAFDDFHLTLPVFNSAFEIICVLAIVVVTAKELDHRRSFHCVRVQREQVQNG